MPWLPVVHTSEDDILFFEKTVLLQQNVQLACKGAESVGFIAYDGIWLNHLYVAPEHWRCGVGIGLLEVAKSSSDRLQLWAFQQNHKARAFYAACGFKEIEITDGRRNEEKAPDVRMVWVKAK